MRLGDRLPNGGIVLSLCEADPGAEVNDLRSHGVVLCFIDRDPGYERFGTWRFHETEDGFVDTFWGHYFEHVIDAVRDYEERVAG